ncbi:hypothetical protein SBDP1_270025 [Syntrophobacter sp. SbD1]|nr:hypothetical protein SBDP1_270025 [Syntrophobacter sp. SbD1]
MDDFGTMDSTSENTCPKTSVVC